LLYRYETHCHTSEASRCGLSSGAQMARIYKELGYTGLFVTDHFFNGNCAVPRNLPWEERIDLFYRGYEAALEEGGKIGLDVFFGAEFKPLGQAAEFLTYNLDRAWWKAHPDMMRWDHERYSREVHAAGGFLIHAHPFRRAPYLPSTPCLYPESVDAVEVINTKQRGSEALYNRQAKAYADRYHLPGTCGSDNHEAVKDNAAGGISSPRKLKDTGDFIALVRSGQYGLLSERYWTDDAT